MSDELPDDAIIGISDEDFEFIRAYSRGEVSLEDFRARFEKDGRIMIPVTVMPTCCFCGEPLEPIDGISPRFWGNNPQPLMEDDVNRCCNDCNSTKVVPARIERHRNGQG